MRTVSHPLIPKKIFWLLPVLLAVGAFLLSRLEISQGLEHRLLDARFKIRGTRSVSSSPLQIVAIDDPTFRVLKEKWPFQGSLYARLVRNLNRAGARLIVFDVEFSEPNQKHPEQDTLLAEAIQQAGNVILPGKVGYQYERNLEKPYTTIIPPLPILKAACKSFGIVNELTDPDDFTRRCLLYLPVSGKLLPSLGLEVLRAMQGIPDTAQIEIRHRTCRLGNQSIPLYDRYSTLINYYGPAGSFPAISFASVLDDSTLDLGLGVDSDYMENFYPGQFHNAGTLRNPFAGKVVLIGAMSEELHDTKNTPFYSNHGNSLKMAGVEVHAQALQTILEGSYIHRQSAITSLLLCSVLAFLIFQLVGSYRLWRGLILSLVLTAGMVAAAQAMFTLWNVWVDLVSLLYTALLTYLGTTVYLYFRERREKISIQEMFEHYVPDAVVKDLIAHPELLKLGGHRCHLSILFADINGFTTISEMLSPEQLVAHLNEYMTAMTQIILEEGGIIDKYEGDLIMAEFGTPVAYPDHAEHACRAALRMQSRLASLRRKWEQEGKPALFIRIGVSTGEVIVGNMGSDKIFDYTVVGDAVNLCSRLEVANKTYGTGILISGATRQELPPAYITRPLGELSVRGRVGAVAIYELMAECAETLTPQQREAMEAATSASEL
jgi:adenylate cyclase